MLVLHSAPTLVGRRRQRSIHEAFTEMTALLSLLVRLMATWENRS